MKRRPPYSRTERLIALGRIPLAAGALIIAWQSAGAPFTTDTLRVLLGAYLAYSIALVPILSPAVQPASWWPLTTQIADLVVVAFAMVLTTGTTSPFFSFLLLSLATATVRWGGRGAAIAGAFVVVVFAAIALGSDAPLFVTAERGLALVVSVAVFTGIGIAQDAERRQFEALATWPQFSSGDRETVSRQVLEAAARVLRARRLLLLWEDSEEPWIETAFWDEGTFSWSRHPPSAFGSVVAEPISAVSFVCMDLDARRPRVAAVREGVTTTWSGVPIDPRLRRLFRMRAVISWPLRDGAISGRLLSIDPDQYGIDDFPFGEVVSRLVAARLALAELVREVEDRATAEGRLKLADDLHDGVLQSLAAASLQLQAARRLFSFDPASADARLAELQQIIAAEQVEIRTVIEAFAPDRSGPRGNVALEGRLRALCARMARQWGVDVSLALEPPTLAVPDTLAQQVFMLVQEALVNVGRHAGAAHASVAILQSDSGLSIVVADDGHGFPFEGRHTAEELRHREIGPRSLAHRVATLGGSLTIESSARGARVEIHVPRTGVAA
jgi:signal transduction histidine kinase